MTLARLATLLVVVALVAASLHAGMSEGFGRYVRGRDEARLRAHGAEAGYHLEP